jgi:hypothetical protein
MVAFLLRLDLIPVGKTVKTRILEIIGKVQIKICRIKFLIDLLIEKLVYLCVHHDGFLLVVI